MDVELDSKMTEVVKIIINKIGGIASKGFYVKMLIICT